MGAMCAERGSPVQHGCACCCSPLRAPLTAPQVGHRHHPVVGQHPAEAAHTEAGLQADVEPAAVQGCVAELWGLSEAGRAVGQKSEGPGRPLCLRVMAALHLAYRLLPTHTDLPVAIEERGVCAVQLQPLAVHHKHGHLDGWWVGGGHF